MAQKILSIGFDTERPYGSWAHTENGIRLREEQLAFAAKINNTYDLLEVPRTFFILGQYLEACLEYFPRETLHEIFSPANPLIEIAQHSYSHAIFRPITWKNDPILSEKEFAEDLARANDALEDILDVKPEGFRTPVGYDKDISDNPRLLFDINHLNLSYVSSDLRSSRSLNAVLGRKRQPHSYQNVGFPGIVEIPSHGWQDNVFTQEHSNRFFSREPDSAAEIFDHYDGLFEKAASMRLDIVNVALTLHPWAIMEYDPELEIHLKLIDSARKKGFEIKTYRDIADIYRQL